jgi:hypothetical protein
MSGLVNIIRREDPKLWQEHVRFFVPDPPNCKQYFKWGRWDCCTIEIWIELFKFEQEFLSKLATQIIELHHQLQIGLGRKNILVAEQNRIE